MQMNCVAVVHGFSSLFNDESSSANGILKLYLSHYVRNIPSNIYSVIAQRNKKMVQAQENEVSKQFYIS
jgi:hypothetical protein